ncbi:MAG: hypothetical protein IKL25_04545 [Clostridia bacterium]|nr:hypothetical protein [Clostridia bacterium]
MKRISAWFHRHPKTRIALQLVLDGLPVLLMAMHFLSFYTVRMFEESGAYHMQPSSFYYVTLACLIIVPIPAFVASFFWRDKAFELFKRCRWCRWGANLLRIASALVVSIVFIVDIFFVVAWISL